RSLVNLNPTVDTHPRPASRGQPRIVLEDDDRFDDRVQRAASTRQDLHAAGSREVRGVLDGWIGTGTAMREQKGPHDASTDAGRFNFCSRGLRGHGGRFETSREL